MTYTTPQGCRMLPRKPEHVAIVESALGHPLPAGAEIHHVDENKANNVNSNLVVCPTRAYHALLHIRKRALDESGHADWRKCPLCKRYDDVANMRPRVKGGEQYRHRECHATAQRQYDQLKKEK